MKQTRFVVCCALTALLCISQNSKAQVPVAASNPDNLITSGGVTDARNVNCDMIYSQSFGNGQLRAIAYDDYSTGNSNVYLEDYSGAALNIPISGALDIDVVLADDMANPGVDYFAVVVYNNGTTAMIETYSITGTGSGSLTATLSGSSSLPMMGGTSYTPPHVDMIPDPSNPINGMPSLHEYAATWAEYQMFVGFDCYLTHGDVSTIGTVINTYTVSSGGTGIWPDVACLWDVVTNEAFAYVPYINGFNIDLFEVNLTSTATSSTSTINGVFVQKSVRIEAMNQYDATTGRQKYEIAYSGGPGGSLDIYSYNDLTANTNLSAALGGGNCIHPAVSAGPGQSLGGGYGNENHSVCWYADGTPFYYSMAIEANTGNVNPAYPDYYEVNQTPTPFIVLDAYYAPIGVSSSSNLGSNELLTAWNNNNDIYYKYQGDISQYKMPTNVNAVVNTNYKLYPNPATNSITVSGISKASYAITDVVGSKLLHGEIKSYNNAINTSILAKGMYVITITENGKNSQLKFIKQ